jgi:hypothetical protein
MSNSPLEARSQALEDLTLDLNEQECQSPGNAKSMPSAGESSSGIGPTPQSVQTYESFNWQTGGKMMLGFKENEVDALHRGQTPAVLISSAADSPAKTSPSPESGKDSPAEGQDSSSTSPELPTTLFGITDGSSLRTYPDFFHQTTEEISESFSRRWPKSGFTTSLGECWTADTSECPNEGGEFSSLPDVLEATVPERFYLSPKAAAGILRRAAKRGRELPPHLLKALQAVAASAPPDDDKRTT